MDYLKYFMQLKRRWKTKCGLSFSGISNLWTWGPDEVPKL